MNVTYSIDESDNNLLITRYPHGACGKFISSILQLGSEVNHWSSVAEHSKKSQAFNDIIVEYTKRKFIFDHSLWVSNEPIHPYNSELYSSTFDRGNLYDYKEYIEYAVKINDVTLIGALASGKYVNITFNKAVLPLFCKKSNVITVTIDNDTDVRWITKTLKNKHFVYNNKIIYTPNDPSRCPFKSLPLILTYKNQYVYSENEKNIAYQTYVDDIVDRWYGENAIPYKYNDEKLRINNINISLSDIFNDKSFFNIMEYVYKEFNLGDFNYDLVKQVYYIWKERQLDYNG